MDMCWNPSHDMQAGFRAYRFGQQKPVYIYRLVAAGTLEDRVYRKQLLKVAMSQRVLDRKEIEAVFPKEALLGMLQYSFTPGQPSAPDAAGASEAEGPVTQTALPAEAEGDLVTTRLREELGSSLLSLETYVGPGGAEADPDCRPTDDDRAMAEQEWVQLHAAPSSAAAPGLTTRQGTRMAALVEGLGAGATGAAERGPGEDADREEGEGSSGSKPDSRRRSAELAGREGKRVRRTGPTSELSTQHQGGSRPSQSTPASATSNGAHEPSDSDMDTDDDPILPAAAARDNPLQFEDRNPAPIDRVIPGSLVPPPRMPPGPGPSAQSRGSTGGRHPAPASRGKPSEVADRSSHAEPSVPPYLGHLVMGCHPLLLPTHFEQGRAAPPPSAGHRRPGVQQGMRP
jgi:hypothetical protein